MDTTSVKGKVDWRGRPARKDKHGGLYNSFFILVLYGFDSFATAALAINLVTYFIGVMHFNIADASTVLTNFLGTSYLLAIAVAYFADTFIGRYKVIFISAIVEMMGLALLLVQAHRPNLTPSPCNIFDPTSICERVHGSNAAILYTGLYLIAAGMAGIKAGVPAHGADQFDENDPRESKQMSSFFNWLLLSACLGAILSLIFVVWIQTHVGWAWGFGVCLIGSFVGTLIYVSGIPRYRIHVIQSTNPITDIIKVYVAAIRNRKLSVPENVDNLYEIDSRGEAGKNTEFLPHTNTFRFLDKAATVDPTSSQAQGSRPWKLCRVTQVEQTKVILAMIPIFASTILMSTCMAQLQTFSIQQGLTMNAHLGSSLKIPPATLPIIPFTFMVLFIPIYDRLFVPFARKFTDIPTGITHFQRIGVGLVLSFVSMGSAALVEVKRKDIARSHGLINAIPVLQPLPITIFWLSFQFFIFGIADVFTYAGLLDFFYSEAPKALKSIATCFFWSSMSLGYFLSTVLVELVNRATKRNTKSGGWLEGNNLNTNHLNLFYWLLAVLSVINFLNFLVWSKWYKYRSQSSRVTDGSIP